MDNTVQEWSSLGILQEWGKVRTAKEPAFPTVVSPLGENPPNLELYGMEDL